MKDSLKTIKQAIEDRTEHIKFGQLFQDEDGTVFVVEKPTGTFVSFDNWTVKRTRRHGEETSSTRLAIKTAEEAGLTVTNKHIK